MSGFTILDVDINAKTITYNSVLESYQAQIINVTTNLPVGNSFTIVAYSNQTINYVSALGAASDAISVGDGLIVMPPGGGQLYTGQTVYSVPEPPAPAVPCVCAGTMISTAAGERPVETLIAGDLVLTADGREVPIKGIYTTKIASCSGRNAPYVIAAGAFGRGLPNAALTVSPGHALMASNGKWMIPCHTTDPSLRAKMSRYANGQEVVYYHVELPNYLQDTFIANGVVSEAYGLNWAKTYKGPSVYTQLANGYFTRLAKTTVRGAAKAYINKK